MKTGILIYAHNNRTLDYALMSLISGGLAKKNLNVPVSLVTDPSTVEWMKESNIFEKAMSIFDNLIIIDRPTTDNQRKLHDGESVTTVPFINSNRHSAWELTPYDRTLLIDSDYLIFSNHLNKYWNVDCDVMIGESINDIYSNDRLGYLDKHISDTGIKMYWATTVMFTKNENSKLFFDMVGLIKENYEYYADIFGFNPTQYRNDIAFSIAKHILDGFEQSSVNSLPPVLTTLDKDILYSIDKDKLKFLINYNLDSNYFPSSVSNIDIHIMNKQSIIRHKDKLLDLI